MQTFKTPNKLFTRNANKHLQNIEGNYNELSLNDNSDSRFT